MISQQITDPTAEIATYLSLVIMLIAIIVYFTLAVKLRRNYKETNSQPSKWLAWFFVGTPIAIFFLILELAVLKIMTPADITMFKVETFTTIVASDPATLPADTEETLLLIDFLGWLFATIAILLSFFSVTFAGLFAVSFLDPKWKKTVVFPAVLSFIYWLMHSFGGYLDPEYGHTWIQEYVGGSWDMAYSETAELISIPLVMLPLLYGVVVLFYVSWKVRVKGRPAFLRAFLIALGILLLSFVYLMELLEPSPLLTAIIRLGFVYFPFHMYYVLIMPDWVKRLIGMPVS